MGYDLASEVAFSVGDLQHIQDLSVPEFPRAIVASLVEIWCPAAPREQDGNIHLSLLGKLVYLSTYDAALGNRGESGSNSFD